MKFNIILFVALISCFAVIGTRRKPVPEPIRDPNLLSQPYVPRSSGHSIAWYRADQCMWKQSDRLIAKGYDVSEVKDLARVACMEEIQLAAHEEKLQGFAQSDDDILRGNEAYHRDR